jgi:hypothetical protein
MVHWRLMGQIQQQRNESKILQVIFKIIRFLYLKRGQPVAIKMVRIVHIKHGQIYIQLVVFNKVVVKSISRNIMLRLRHSHVNPCKRL